MLINPGFFASLSGARVARRRFVAMGAAGLVAAAVAAPALGEKARVSIALDNRHSFQQLALTGAEQLDYFRSEGLDIELLNLEQGSRALQALSSGQADLASLPYEYPLRQHERRPAFRSFVQLCRSSQLALAVSNRALPGYQGAEDLRGRPIGVAEAGSPGELMARLLLAHAGVPAEDSNLVAVGRGAAALMALRGGQVDALCTDEPVISLLEQRGEIKVVADARSLKGTTALFGGAVGGVCLFGSQEFVLRNPQTVQALTNAVVRALKWLRTAGPSDLIKTLPEESYLLGDRGLYLAAFQKLRESFSLDGVLPEDGPALTLGAMAQFEPALKTLRADLSAGYTNEFALHAKERFKA